MDKEIIDETVRGFKGIAKKEMLFMYHSVVGTPKNSELSQKLPLVCCSSNLVVPIRDKITEEQMELFYQNLVHCDGNPGDYVSVDLITLGDAIRSGYDVYDKYIRTFNGGIGHIVKVRDDGTGVPIIQIMFFTSTRQPMYSVTLNNMQSFDRFVYFGNG